jgi:transposase
MASAGVSGTVTVDDQRSYFEIETIRGKNPTEIHTIFGEVCGEQTVDRSTDSRWATRFREGRVTVNDDPRPGRPKTSTDERSVELVADFLAEDRRATREEISQGTGISPTSIFLILSKDLQKRNICALWLPQCLTTEQKQKRLEIATLPKQRFNVEGQAFLYRIIAIDETWIRDFEPDLKSESNEWIRPNSPRPKKFRHAQSKIKQKMIFAYDHRGIIMTDRVPCGTSVTAAYYRDWLQNLRRK